LKKPKLVRITTVPVSMNIILKGQLAYMNQFFEVIGVTGYDEKHFEDVHKREEIRMEAIAMARTISPLSDLKSLWKLYRFLKKEKPAIVHTHTPKAGLLGMIASYFAGVPIRLHTVAGMPLMELKGLKKEILGITERLTYACAHQVYPNSKGLRKIIMNYGFCKAEKLKVIANGASNGVNVDLFDPHYASPTYRSELRAKHGISDELVFCFVGRIALEKGIAELVNAFEKLQQEKATCKIKLVLIGTFEKHYGLLGEDLEQKISNHPDMLALGRFDDVRPYYLMSDVFVFPSYREGFPNALMEAGAMALPSIATDINGCNEIIEDGHNGILIRPKNEEDLYLRKSLAANARKIIVEKFRRELIWKGLEEEYKHQLKKIGKDVKHKAESLN
jgi:glycosyltransferase involved in cell wall biosynthesis